MNDQAKKLRAKVTETKLSNLIDDLKNIKDIAEIYKNILVEKHSNTKIIVFFSAKAGIGKSSIIYSAATAIKKANKTSAIIDLNPMKLDIDIFFEQPHINRITKNNILNNSTLAINHTSPNQHIFHIGSDLPNLELQLLRIIIYQAKLSNFDYILIDCPVVNPEFINSLIPLSDIFFYIITPTIKTIEISAEYIKNVVRNLNESFCFNLIINYFFNSFNNQKILDTFLNEINDAKNIRLLNSAEFSFDNNFFKNQISKNTIFDCENTAFFKQSSAFFNRILFAQKNNNSKNFLDKLLNRD